ncbi:myocardin-related transcription factor A-like isoform X2 [Brienomyrus brachyistius]|uniref:myocardin-related transcription factor A-like isoform X2 n=1 Tax=Brienomyrus brachyistius TaxID=42636 RepID=UPI0020B356FA|nr:myocardin-related transcription factor A-like isoform X2 [Brienomyrus brachyistius]
MERANSGDVLTLRTGRTPRPPALSTMDPPLGVGASPSEGVSCAVAGSAPSPRSEAVTNEMQELSLQAGLSLLPLQERKNGLFLFCQDTMLDTNPLLRIDPAPLGVPRPIRDGPEKRAIRLDYERHACQSLREVLQLKLQQRRTREELVSQGIMPPLKSPAAFHEQRRSLERARTEDYLKRKIRSRPERSELVRMHILKESSAEPSLQARQLQLKRARLADDLNDKIAQRPGPMELIHKNILPVHSSVKQALLDFPKGATESSSFDDDSSDGFSPSQLGSQDSPLGSGSQPSPPDTLSLGVGDPSPTQAPLPAQPPPAPPVPPLQQKLTNGTATPPASRPSPLPVKAQGKTGSDRAAQRSKKPKDSKPKVKKLKYHQYIPPDQKVEREPPPQLDSSYAKILQQQQLFLQLQIISQQQQHYNYHTILPAPPKPPAEQQSASTSGPSPSRGGPTPALTTSSGPLRQAHPTVVLPKLGPLPPNLDDFKVAELKQELKIRGLPVSGTKNDLLERLRSFQEQNGGPAPSGGTTGVGAPKCSLPQQLSQPVGPSPILGGATVLHQSGGGGVVVAAAFPFVAAIAGGGAAPVPPPPIMKFGSTSSSPPESPAPSDRSLAGMSPDETSSNGDTFGDTVSSPLTQLNLHSSPLPPTVIKDEAPAMCRFSRCPHTLDKDQMLQEKDKQIEELTRMLQQKQRLVETLRSQLEQGKQVGAELQEVRVKQEPDEGVGETTCCAYDSYVPDLSEDDTIQVTIKEEVEDDLDDMLPQADLQLGSFDQPVVLPLTQQPMETQQSKVPQMLQPMEPQAQRSVGLQQRQAPQTHRPVEIPRRQAAQAQQPMEIQQRQTTQMRQPVELEHQRQQWQQAPQGRLVQDRPASAAHKKKKKKKRRPLEVEVQQVLPVFGSQQPAVSMPAPSISLGILKSRPPPTLLNNSNSNHFLVALGSRGKDGQEGALSQSKGPGNRVQSTPTKPSSQSPPATDSNAQSKSQFQPGLNHQLVKKGLKVELQVSTNQRQESNSSLSAPPNLQPFFLGNEPAPSDDPAPSDEPAPSPPSHMVGMSSGLDGHALFGPLSPAFKKQSPTPPLHDKENNSSEQMANFFDILIESGEIPASFKDPGLSCLDSRTLPPSPSHSPLHFSAPVPLEPPVSQHPLEGEPQAPVSAEQEVAGTGSGRLEDFLESTTGKPLLGVEPGGPVTLIDDLHSQMLSTSSILDHPPSPMDTCELSFTPHFGEPGLDGMDWLDITMGVGASGLSGVPPLGSHSPPSVFSADFFDSTDLQLNWDTCL